MGYREISKSAWQDKFRTPTVAELRCGLSRGLQPVFDILCHDIAGGTGVLQSVEWHGVPWRWTVVYTLPGAGSGALAVAYIIPDPARLQVCVPLTAAQIEAIGVNKLSRGLRDGILFARSVAGVWWATWETPSKGAAHDVLELLARKQELRVRTDSRRAVGA